MPWRSLSKVSMPYTRRDTNVRSRDGFCFVESNTCQMIQSWISGKRARTAPLSTRTTPRCELIQSLGSRLWMWIPGTWLDLLSWTKSNLVSSPNPGLLEDSWHWQGQQISCWISLHTIFTLRTTTMSAGNGKWEMLPCGTTGNHVSLDPVLPVIQG